MSIIVDMGNKNNVNHEFPSKKKQTNSKRSKINIFPKDGGNL